MKRDEALESEFWSKEMVADLVEDFDMSEVEPWLVAQKRAMMHIDDEYDFDFEFPKPVNSKLQTDD